MTRGVSLHYLMMVVSDHTTMLSFQRDRMDCALWCRERKKCGRARSSYLFDDALCRRISADLAAISQIAVVSAWYVRGKAYQGEYRRVSSDGIQ